VPSNRSESGDKTGILAASDRARHTAAAPDRPSGLYAISSGAGDEDALAQWAQAVLAGGAVWLQYRDKGRDRPRRLAEAQRLLAACRRHGARLIVNDDVELALAAGADGVHLGRDDGELAAARAVLGDDALIGVSCYADLARARRLAAQGADYLAFGAFHPSPTKPAAAAAGTGLLREARALGLPLVAIGGITPDNGGALVRAGADLLAVVSGLALPPAQAAAAARRYAALFAPPHGSPPP
jgi:thiamine-phosphate pyrophosphorylase